ncbi:MAG TPA: YegS/Rv2252/BmrU family lipid kinase [Burkholderiales bacterium]
MTAPALVIVNPVAGRGRVRAQWPQAEQALRRAGVRFEAVETAVAGDAERRAAQAAAEGRCVIAAGGDGTVHEVVNGLLRASNGADTVPLGVLPLGSGDDFAKMLPPAAIPGARARGLDDAVARIAAGQVQRFDAGRIEAGDAADGVRFFANGMDIGFGARGAANAAAMPQALKGQARYLGALAKTLVHYANPRVRLTLDDAAPLELETTMTAIMNGRSFGGSFWVCPQAEVRDGWLDVMIASALGRIAILGLVPRIMRGTHVGDARVQMRRARRVRIESASPMAVEADGELPFAPVHRLEVTVLPGVLRVLAGPAIG